jgi:hypothetical protein
VVFRNIKFCGRQGYTSSKMVELGVHPLISSSHVVTHAIMKRYIHNVTPAPKISPNHLTPTHGPRRDQTCRYLHCADPTVGRSRTARWTLIDETHVGLMQVQMYKRARARLVRRGRGGRYLSAGRTGVEGTLTACCFPNEGRVFTRGMYLLQLRRRLHTSTI